MMTQLGVSAIVGGGVWAAVGMVLYFGYQKYKRAQPAQEEELCVEPPQEPSPEEKEKMDREYRLWRNIVILAVALSVALYVVPYVML